MATGLIALLDDVAALAKLAAASLDDVAAQTLKAGGKAAGVVIDDAAVTPKYVVGLEASRELSIIRRIAVGSLRNKLLFILPAALLLSVFLPWAITPLLMLGGLYLCYEGAEKLIHLFQPHHGPHGEDGKTAADAAALEDEMVAGAIRTDFILSAEIMAIALATIEVPELTTRALVLVAVAVVITVAVYGAVAIIVKADDVGVRLARSSTGLLRGVGRLLVAGMPRFLSALSIVGTLAMLWVGGGILLHGIAELGWHGPEDAVYEFAHAVAPVAGPLEPAVEWLLKALAAGLVGLVVGWAILGVLAVVRPEPVHG